MSEHIAPVLYYLQIHLLYASVVGLAACALSSIRNLSATAKYWIWVVTSLNFVVPMGGLFDRFGASSFGWATPLGFVGYAADVFSQGRLALVLALVWLLGTVLMAMRLGLRLRADRRQAHAGVVVRHPDLLAHGVPVNFVRGRQAPAVDGVLRPHISLPSGIDRVLNAQELSAVLLHEATHAKRRDNLIRLIHELCLCALWFHPLIWITSSRLSLYRELSCDESVIHREQGGDLVTALAKLANPEEPFLLQATASSYLSHRVARLSSPPPRYRAISGLLTAVFLTLVAVSVFGTVAHTACCFIGKR